MAGWRLRVGTQPWRGVRGKVWPEPLEPGLQLEGRSLQVAALGRLPAGMGPGGWAGSQASRDPGVSFGTMGQALSLITRPCGQWCSHSPLCGELWELLLSSSPSSEQGYGLIGSHQSLSWHCAVEHQGGHTSSSHLPPPFLMGFHKGQAPGLGETAAGEVSTGSLVPGLPGWPQGVL